MDDEHYAFCIFYILEQKDYSKHHNVHFYLPLQFMQ